MSQVPAMFSRGIDGSISGVTFYLDATPYQADNSLPSFKDLLDELKKANPDAERLISLTQPAQAIVTAVAKAVEADYLPAGVVAVTSSEVRYNGESVTGVLVDRILSMLAEGFDIMPMIRFLENLYLNPATYARDELYLWLENSNLPITEDGHFLAYKLVSNEYRSRNNFLNLPGTTVSMPRQACDPIRDHLCSTGLHFCSKDYLGSYAGVGNKIVMVKINPADVVSIPSDAGNSKGRAWKYDILTDFGDDPQTKIWPSIVDKDGNDVSDAYDGGDGYEDLLVFPSDLSKALFAALNEIDITDREDRLQFADENLAYDRAAVSSFTELTQYEAGLLIEEARAIKAEQDAEAEADAQDAAEEAHEAAEAASDLATHAKRVRIDAINSYGIETLRAKASQAGLVGAWKGPKKAELVAFLISKI